MGLGPTDPDGQAGRQREAEAAESDNYLDPERDYELINDLRKFIMNNAGEEADELEDAHYAACDKS